jgi:uroporphyrinogen decarboxylase
MTRREVLLSLPALALGAKLNHKERVDRALQGLEVDRPPFTFWYHFGLEKHPGERHARATLEFHRKFGTDLVKVMSDYPFPRRAQPWYALPVEENPFPEQIRALEVIRDGLAGSAYFVETIFNPWNVAEKLSSREEVLRLRSEKPQALLDALERIARSEANHARRAVAAGASGIFLAIANADASVLTEADYARFSEPFDRMILEAVKEAPLNTLHLHGSKVYLHRFYRGWPAAVFHYSTHATGVPIGEVRRQYSWVLMGGLDETNFRKLTETQLREQWQAAAKLAGHRFILAPGCSVPDDTRDEELMRLVRVLS